jgi:class 3 adenylate cyclase
LKRSPPDSASAIVTIPGAELARDAARRVNDIRELETSVALLRRLLPGDPDFGDPLSAMGNEPTQLVARRAYQLADGRLRLLGELGLAVLQVADWLNDGTRSAPQEVAIAFTDLVGFSEWALDAGDERSLELLRRVGVVMTAAVEAREGRIVKRLGDGTMAVFPDAADALESTREAFEALGSISVDGYTPRLRGGIHFGEPWRIGGDYLGVDVTVASRLCDSAAPGEILLSDDVAERIDDVASRVWQPAPLVRKGTPANLRVYRVRT